MDRVLCVKFWWRKREMGRNARWKLEIWETREPWNPKLYSSRDLKFVSLLARCNESEFRTSQSLFVSRISLPVYRYWTPLYTFISANGYVSRCFFEFLFGFQFILFILRQLFLFKKEEWFGKCWVNHLTRTYHENPNVHFQGTKFIQGLLHICYVNWKFIKNWLHW